MDIGYYLLKCHMTAFFLGFVMDMLFGDPHWLPHPVRLIGGMVHKMECCLRSGKKREEKGKDRNGQNGNREFHLGLWLVVVISGIVFGCTALILILAYSLHPHAGMAAEAVMTYQILAAKCLKDESMKVYRCLKRQDLEKARAAVSMIVGRDTAELNEEGVIKAAIETVAENTSDGVIAPMLYTAVGGPVLGLWYKAVNTMDSMIGYKNDTYLYFGRAAAKLDDWVNFFPARISAALMITASFVGGKCFSGKRAFLIYKRDRKKHASPNSAQTESVCAGALGIRLAGDACYFGKLVKKPCIGDECKKAELEDIKRTNRLMYLAAWLGQAICLAGMALLLYG